MSWSIGPTDLHVVEAGADAAPDVVAVIHAAFAARPHLDPPSTALQENVESVGAALAEHGGLLVLVDGRPAGALLFAPARHQTRGLGLRRVCVDPEMQHRGVASALVGCAEEVAARRGFGTVVLTARVELPATLRFWLRRGYVEVDRDGVQLTYAKALPVEVDLPTAAQTHDLGGRLAGVLRAGDLVLLAGDLGAGKTTLTQGIGGGLQVRGRVTSPTFVISRLHPSLVGGPPLVHVDAYRLGGIDELDDLDLDTDLDDAVTVVEWGEDLAEPLSADRLEVHIRRRHGTAADDADPAGAVNTADPSGPDGPDGSDGSDGDDPRHLRVTPTGRRWVGVDLRPLLRATS